MKMKIDQEYVTYKTKEFLSKFTPNLQIDFNKLKDKYNEFMLDYFEGKVLHPKLLENNIIYLIKSGAIKADYYKFEEIFIKRQMVELK